MCTCAHTHVLIHAHEHSCVHVHMHIHTCMDMCAYVYVHVYVYVQVCGCTRNESLRNQKVVPFLNYPSSKNKNGILLLGGRRCLISGQRGDSEVCRAGKRLSAAAPEQRRGWDGEGKEVGGACLRAESPWPAALGLLPSPRLQLLSPRRRVNPLLTQSNECSWVLFVALSLTQVPVLELGFSWVPLFW